MKWQTLPPRAEMMAAFQGRDSTYDGLFLTAVRTTGIFCRPVCSGKKPRPENVEFFATAREALFSGYRPCRRCRPLDNPGDSPDWLEPLLSAVDSNPGRRWRAADLREMGIAPERARRWFQRHHQMTFHAYARARRLGAALAEIRTGASVTEAAFDHGYASLSGFNQAFRDVLGAPPTELARRQVVWMHHLPTPLGPMVVGATDERVCLLEFADRRALEAQLRNLARRLDAVFVPGLPDVTRRLEDRLDRYFDGAVADLATEEVDEGAVPIHVVGTPFQEDVWRSLMTIPAGETRTYGDLARSLGRSGAVRAVGRANGANRLAILVPCHRVVGSDGRLAGYGGGLWRKQRLLELERGRPTGDSHGAGSTMGT